MNKALKSLSIENFKCFRELHVHFGGLTVLCGLNSAGKSTVFQPVLLLSQTLRRNRSLDLTKISNLLLNGELLDLGTAGEVWHEKAPSKSINFMFEFSDGKPHYFNCEAIHSEANLSIQDSGNTRPALSSRNSKKIIQPISDLTYISTNRTSQQFLYPKPNETDSQFVNVGTDGRFACYWYNELADAEVDKVRCNPSEESNIFRKQMDAWLSEIAKDVKVNVLEFDHSVYSLNFKFMGMDDWKRPANAGLGLSSVFPILVALLNAKEGDLIIIESPEIQLHPKAQSALGTMISKFASTGIQIIIETHSEHILNGIRIGVKGGKLDPSDLEILFFAGVSEDSIGVHSLSVNENGRISNWPKGFFDQNERDLMEIHRPQQ